MNPLCPITGLLAGMTSQNYPRIATDGAAVAIVWKQVISGQSQLPILFTNDISLGFPAQYDSVDLNDITNADVAIRDGMIHIVWEDPNTGTVKYRSGTYGSVLGIDNPVHGEVNIYPNPAGDMVNIQIPNEYSGNSTLSITDVLAKKISVSVLVLNNGQSTIDLNELMPGIYLLDLEVEREHFITRIVKN